MQTISQPSTTQVFEITEILLCGRLAQEESTSAAPSSNNFFIGLNVNLM